MGRGGSVPCMGQMKSGDGRNERANSALGTDFAEDVSVDRVARALATARERLAVAEDAHDLVTLQAIRSLSTRGLSTREIAGVVGISKSAVSRHLRAGFDGVVVQNSEAVTAIIRHAWASG